MRDSWTAYSKLMKINLEVSLLKTKIWIVHFALSSSHSFLGELAAKLNKFSSVINVIKYAYYTLFLF